MSDVGTCVSAGNAFGSASARRETFGAGSCDRGRKPNRYVKGWRLDEKVCHKRGHLQVEAASFAPDT
jgi:hypothetical protein